MQSGWGGRWERGWRCGGDPSAPVGCSPPRCHHPRVGDQLLVGVPRVPPKPGWWRCRQEELPARRKPRSSGAAAELLPQPPPFSSSRSTPKPSAPPLCSPHPSPPPQIPVNVTQIPLTQPQEPWPDKGASKEPSRSGRGSGGGPRGAQPPPKSPLEGTDSDTAVPLCRKPGLVDVRAEQDAAPKPPASCQTPCEDKQGTGSSAGVRSSPQPGLGGLGGVAAPQTPASVAASEATPQGKGSGSPHRGI